MSFRKERKYKLTISEFDRLKNQLLRIGMENLFQPRKINSLYYDTDAYDLHHHSEDGVVPRKKIRIRWYDSVKNASVETKISSITMECLWKENNNKHSPTRTEDCKGNGRQFGND